MNYNRENKLNLAATIHEFLHSRQITGLPSRVAGVLVISTVAVWKTGTSYYNTILISPSRTFMLVLLANLIVVLHLHLHPRLPFHLLF
ncbi:hypothetical protein NC652_004301 [Populus alba x Populus x berolinensis]|nr:hypothetical protein NC651_004199 [Populus alba x Populus x berolinensis]KAJ6966699.1 hypothetical protein NC652_004301 [Populus alba x Populus x berolinensis]